MEKTLNSSESLILGEKHEFDSDLFNNLSLAKISILKKCLFKSYFLIIHSVRANRFFTVRNYAIHLGVIIKQLQLLYLTYNERKSTGSSDYEVFIREILKKFMIDHYAVSNSEQDFFTVATLSISLSLIVSVLLIFSQVFFKKRIFMSFLVVVVNSATWVLNTFCFIPFVIYSLTYSKYASSGAFYVEYYQADLKFNSSLAPVYVAALVAVCIHFFFIAIFNNISEYNSEVPRARTSSLLIIKQQVGVFVLASLFVMLHGNYYLIVTSLISLYLLKELVYCQPYYSFYDNLIDSGSWLMVCTSSILFLIDNFINLSETSLLILVFFTPLGYILLVYYMSKSLVNRINCETITPEDFELKIRHKLYKINEISEELHIEIQEMFNEATVRFIEYQMLPIWECNFILQSNSNYTLAMMKLMKIRFAKRRPKLLPRADRIFHYSPSIECEFLAYTIAINIKKITYFKDAAFIKYCKDVFIFDKLDFQTCLKLLSLIDSYLSNKNIPLTVINNNCKNFYSSISTKESSLKSCVAKYGQDQLFIEKSQGFKEDLLKMSNNLHTLHLNKTKENFLEKLGGHKYGRRLGTLIISGHPDIIGRIIYANEQIVSFLSFPNEVSLVGLNFVKLIPDPFADLHKNILTKFELFSGKSELSRPEIFLLDYNGFCIEVSMEVRAAFYKNIIYFIVDITEKIPYECFILCSPGGKVYACSEKLKDMFPKYMQRIDEVFPKLQDYITQNPMNVEFDYNEDNKVALLRWNQLEIQNQKLMVIYFLSEHNMVHFLSYEQEKSISEYKRDFWFKGKALDESKDYKKSITVNKRKLRKSKEKVQFTQKFLKDETLKIKSSIKLLKYNIWIGFTALFCIYMSIVIYSEKFIDDNTVFAMLTDVCSFRYKTASMINKMRAIDLNRIGIPGDFIESSYNESIFNSSLAFKSSLNNLNSINNRYQIKNLFDETRIIFNFFESGKVTQEEVTLYEGMYLYIAKVSQFIKTNYTDYDTKLFIYRNSFDNLQTAINLTTLKTLDSFIENSSQSLTILNIISGLSLAPIYAVFIVSIPIFFSLQKISTSQWQDIKGIPKSTFVVIRNRLIERIKRCHNPNFFQDYEISQLPYIKSNIWVKFFSKLSILLILSLTSFLILFYVSETNLRLLFKLRLQHIFYGGLRTLTVKSFVWSREAHLAQINISYFSIFKNFSDIINDSEKFLESVNEIDYYAKYVLKEAQSFQSSSKNFADYIDFLIGDTCKYTSLVANCSSTIVAGGVIQAIFNFVNELKNLAESKQLTIKTIAGLEKQCNYYEKSLTSGIDLYGAITSEFIDFYKEIIILVCCIIIVITFFFAVLLLIPEINDICNELLSRNEFLMLLKDSSVDKTGCLDDSSVSFQE